MPKYVFSAEFDCIEDHSFLIKGMFTNTLQSLLGTNAVKAIGPIELCRASEQGESPATDRQQLQAKIAAIAQAVNDNYDNGDRIGHGWLLGELRQLSAMQ